jgi:hypothetical protein
LKTMHIQTHIIYRPNSPPKKTALQTNAFAQIHAYADDTS